MPRDNLLETRVLTLPRALFVIRRPILPVLTALISPNILPPL